MGEAIKAGAMPVLCGGEHITTIGGSMAVDRHAPEGTYGLILVDTHLDTAPDVGGERINHCCPITRAMELEAFDPAKCVIIGPHGAMNPKSEYAYVREAGVTVYHVSDVDRRGARAIAEEAVQIASDGTDGVYFSFDVDSLDSSVCTGTCVPTMGGLTAREALTMVSVIGRCEHRGDGRLRGRAGVRQRRVGDGRLPGDRRHAGRLRRRAPLTDPMGPGPIACGRWVPGPGYCSSRSIGPGCRR